MKAPRGNPKLSQVRNKVTIAANKQRKELADEHARQTAELLLEASLAGVKMPYRNYADWLNDTEHRTRRGNLWTAREVYRVFKKLKDPEFAKTLKP